MLNNERRKKKTEQRNTQRPFSMCSIFINMGNVLI